MYSLQIYEHLSHLVNFISAYKVKMNELKVHSRNSNAVSSCGNTLK